VSMSTKNDRCASKNEARMADLIKLVYGWGGWEHLRLWEEQEIIRGGERNGRNNFKKRVKGEEQGGKIAMKCRALGRKTEYRGVSHEHSVNG